MLRVLVILMLPLSLCSAAEPDALAAHGDELRERVADAPEQAIEILRRHGAHSDWRIRATVVDLLAEHVTDRSAQAMLDALSRDDDVRVRTAVVDTAARMLGPGALDLLDRLARSEDARLRAGVATALRHLAPLPGEQPARPVLGLLSRLFEDPAYQVRLALIDTLSFFPGSQGTEFLLRATADACEEVVHQAALQLTEREGYNPATLIKRLRAKKPEDRVAACLALGVLGLAPADRALLAAFEDREWEVRAAAVEAVGRMAGSLKDRRGEAFEKVLYQVLAGDQDEAVRATAAWALARIGSNRCVEILIRLVDLPGGDAVRAVLNRWIGQDFATAEEWDRWYRRHGRDLQLEPLAMEEVSSFSFYELEEETDSVVFVIDVSGSMNDREWNARENRLDKLRRELWGTLLQFSDHTRINAHLFAGQILTWSEGPRRSTWRNRYALLRHIEDRNAGGSTNLHDALMAGIEAWSMQSVMLLTDGEPTAGPIVDPQQIIDAVVTANDLRENGARVSAVGIGIPQMAAFLKQLAQRTGGSARMAN